MVRRKNVFKKKEKYSQHDDIFWWFAWTKSTFLKVKWTHQFQIFHTNFQRIATHHKKKHTQGAPDHNLKDKETQNSLQRHLDVTCGKLGSMVRINGSDILGL